MINYLKFHLKRIFLFIKIYLERNSNLKGADSYYRKWKRINKYRKDYNLGILIETGTYYGLTVSNFLNTFESIFSIEIDNYLFHQNRIHFKKNKNVNIIHGDSKSVLPTILESDIFNEGSKILYWLDGHCSEGETGIGDQYSPLVREIEIIHLYSKKYISIIIIDDVRLFDGVNYPTLETLFTLFRKYNYSVSIDGDGLVCIPSELNII